MTTNTSRYQRRGLQKEMWVKAVRMACCGLRPVCSYFEFDLYLQSHACEDDFAKRISQEAAVHDLVAQVQ